MLELLETNAVQCCALLCLGSAFSFSSRVASHLAQVVDHVLKLLETSAVGAQPRSAEAQRVLSFFMSSLNNPTMVSESLLAPSLNARAMVRVPFFMSSLNNLTW